MVVYWRWIFQNSLFSWGDFSFFMKFPEAWKYWIATPLAWDTVFSGTGFGQYNIIMSSYPLYHLLAGFVFIGVKLTLVLKLFIFIPSIIFPVLFSYILIHHLTKNKIASFVGSLVYSYNAYILTTQSYGHIQIIIVYGLAPLILFLYLIMLKFKKFSTAVLTGIVCFIASFYEFRIFYIIAWVLFLFTAFYLLFIQKNKNRSSILWLVFLTSTPMAITLLSNIYWLLPLSFSGSGSDNLLLGRQLFGNQFMNLKQSIALFYPFWTGGAYANWQIQPIPYHFWLIPVFAGLGLIANLKNKYVYFFGLISILGILLTKQSDIPFSGLYLWLYTHFPGFNAFREASKFYLLSSLGYSVLIAFYVKASFHIWNEHLTKKIALSFLVITVSGIFLLNTIPLVTGKIGLMFNQKQISPDYQAVAKFLTDQTGYFRTLWIPAASQWAYTDETHPKTSLYELFHYQFYKILPALDEYTKMENTSNSIKNTEHQIFDLISQSYSDNILDRLSVKYLIIPDSNGTQDDIFNIYKYSDRGYVLTLLSGLPYLKKIDINSNDIFIFENTNYRPLLYLTSHRESAQTPEEFVQVYYQKVSPVRYTVFVRNIKDKVYLNFTQSYDRNWKLYIKGNQLPDDFHEISDLGLNQYSLRPQYFIDNDYGLDLELTLFYSPQRLTHIGFIISLISTIIVITYLIIYATIGIRHHSHQKFSPITEAVPGKPKETNLQKP